MEFVASARRRCPSLDLEPLHQRYRRLDATTYRYERGGGAFADELPVDRNGFVTDRPGIRRPKPRRSGT